MPFTKILVGDILVSGKDDADHLKHLEAVLRTLKDCGLHLKRQKCFMASQETYLGFEISKDGVSPVYEKIKPLIDVPVPENTSQLIIIIVTYAVSRAYLNRYTNF